MPQPSVVEACFIEHVGCFFSLCTVPMSFRPDRRMNYLILFLNKLTIGHACHTSGVKLNEAYTTFIFWEMKQKRP